MTTAHPPAYYHECTIAQASVISQAVDDAVRMVKKGLDGGLATPLYKKWFGNADIVHVKEVYQRMWVNLMTMNMAFDCDCYTPHYAKVNSENPFVIYICPLFWNPRSGKFNTHGGVIIHELSHFEVIGSTDDNAVGVTNSLEIALHDGRRAMNNADTYEFYLEDIQ